MKLFNKIEQSGRSMIEMLGVLAIIGVLSVGGISGYSKAMAKFKLTKAQDQLAMILINIRTAFAGSANYEGLTNATAVSLNIVPSDMLPGGVGNTSGVTSTSGILNAFSGAVTIATEASNQHFTVKFDGLSREACSTLASADWGAEGLVEIDINGTAQYSQENLPIKPTTAINNCSLTDSTNSITWEYY